MFSVGDLVKYDGKVGVIILHVQRAWGAHRYRVLLPNGSIADVWDKHLVIVACS